MIPPLTPVLGLQKRVAIDSTSSRIPGGAHRCGHSEDEGVGPASLRVVREYLDTGESPTASRIVAGSGKSKEIEAERALRRHFLSAAMVRKVLSEPKRGAVKVEDYRGDFQMHSRGSDGSDTVDTLAKGCMQRGYRCMCVTDHSYGLPIAGGMSMIEMRAQHAGLTRSTKNYGGDFHIFKGVEANILQDGSLDMDAAELGEFDLVVASPHSSLRKGIDQTGRICGRVDARGTHLGHPRGRVQLACRGDCRLAGCVQAGRRDRRGHRD